MLYKYLKSKGKFNFNKIKEVNNRDMQIILKN